MSGQGTFEDILSLLVRENMKGEVSSGREFRFIVEDVTCNIFTLSLEKEYEETLPYLKHLPFHV